MKNLSRSARMALGALVVVVLSYTLACVQAPPPPTTHVMQGD